MIRHVSYPRAMLPGAAGAAAREAAARALILSGFPIFSVVHLLGAVALPAGSPVVFWTIRLL